LSGKADPQVLPSNITGSVSGHGSGTPDSDSIDPATIALPPSPEPDTDPASIPLPPSPEPDTDPATIPLPASPEPDTDSGSIPSPDSPLSLSAFVSSTGISNESLPERSTRSKRKNKYSPDQARQYKKLILRLANPAPHIRPLCHLTDQKDRLGSLSVLRIPRSGQVSTEPVTEVDVNNRKTDEIADVVRVLLEEISSTSHQRVILIEDISYITPSILEQCFHGCLPNPGFLADHLSTSRNQSHNPMSVQRMRALGGRHSSIHWWRPYGRAKFPPHLNEKRWQILLDSGSCKWQTRPQPVEGWTTPQTNNVIQHSFDIETNVRRDEWHPLGSSSEQADLAAWEEKATIYVVEPPDEPKTCM
jgi:hypothetical protein